MTNALLTSPLHERHQILGAKMADFGGWEMPIEYPGTGGGVLIEHKAVREAVGVFDVSHLGKAMVSGPGAAEFINATLSNDLRRIGPGQAQYTLCCDDASGGVVDDLIAYYLNDEQIFLIPNASNTAEVVRRLQVATPAEVTVTNQHQDFAVIAVQGPKSAQLLALLGLPADHDYLSFTMSDFEDTEIIVCRTGYTGEHGYELVLPADQALAVWDRLLEHGDALGARACGLGSRDTLRTEMGYPLHGQDLSMQITPNQARSGWAVGWKKEQFWGKAPLSAERESKAARLLWGLKATGRGIPRAQMTVLKPSGEECGVVTSGTFSPTLRTGIGLALIDRASAITEGDTVQVDVRGRPETMTVLKPPFVDSHVR